MKKQPGFTLIELFLVLAVILVCVGVVGAVLNDAHERAEQPPTPPPLDELLPAEAIPHQTNNSEHAVLYEGNLRTALIQSSSDVKVIKVCDNILATGVGTFNRRVVYVAVTTNGVAMAIADPHHTECR